jgi:hypothetical protein
VGIWIPRRLGSAVEWLRDPQRRLEAVLWANVPRIPPKGARKRVLYLGESVARGFFLDPDYTPGQCLQGLMERTGQSGGVEVIDLAHTDMSLGGLRDLAFAGASMQPDAYVIFAGNNWVVFNQIVRRNLEEIAPRLAQTRGVESLKAFLESWLARQTERFLLQLAELSKATRAAIVYVLPEFNLGDFRVDSRKCPPCLGTGARNVQEWFEKLDEARSLLDKGQWELAADCARGLISLDAGTTSAGFALLAKCHA